MKLDNISQTKDVSSREGRLPVDRRGDLRLHQIPGNVERLATASPRCSVEHAQLHGHGACSYNRSIASMATVTAGRPARAGLHIKAASVGKSATAFMHRPRSAGKVTYNNKGIRALSGCPVTGYWFSAHHG